MPVWSASALDHATVFSYLNHCSDHQTVNPSLWNLELGRNAETVIFLKYLKWLSLYLLEIFYYYVGLHIELQEIIVLWFSK